jgi:hypothetical protein
MMPGKKGALVHHRVTVRQSLEFTLEDVRGRGEERRAGQGRGSG